jgi:hypothetical protein
MKLTVGMALLVILTTGCNVEREWISSRDPSEAEAQEEVQKQAAFFDIEDSPELVRAARELQDYVDGQSELLVGRTEKFVAAVESGDVNKARTLYAPSRVPWERIEPIAEKFGTLDPQQERLHFASLDLMRAVRGGREDVRRGAGRGRERPRLRTTRRHRGGPGPDGRAADHHLRFRADALREGRG